MFVVLTREQDEGYVLKIPCESLNFDLVEHCYVENVFDDKYEDKIIDKKLHFVLRSNDGKKTEREIVFDNSELENDAEVIFNKMFEAYAEGKKVFYI